MKTRDYDYNLPDNLIAQTPLENRCKSKLLVMDKITGNLKEEVFEDIIDYLDKDDVLVLNDTRVLPARLIGEKEKTRAVIELLLLKNIKEDTWECLSKPQKRLKLGTKINFGNELVAEVINILNDGITHVKFIYDGIFLEVIDDLGAMPLPPYIHEKLSDKDRYQTVYAKETGSAAAPTAGLHFTKDLLAKLEKKNIEILYITLHVGLGTFRPVEVSDVNDHKMHSEVYKMTKEVADKLNVAKEKNKNIIAVGTTSLRTLESIMNKHGKYIECEEETDIFIYPGYKFKAVDSLITNFHLPKSTLLMLVSALSSKENILNAYNYAIENKFRFFSFGDAMYIRKEK